MPGRIQPRLSELLQQEYQRRYIYKCRDFKCIKTNLKTGNTIVVEPVEIDITETIRIPHRSKIIGTYDEETGSRTTFIAYTSPVIAEWEWVDGSGATMYGMYWSEIWGIVIDGQNSYQTAIHVQNGRSIRIVDVSIRGFTGISIDVVGGVDVIIENSYILGGDIGIRLSSERSNVINSYIEGARVGIQDEGTSNSIIQNIVYHSLEDGILLNGASNSNVLYNISRDNDQSQTGKAGIRIFNSVNNLIKGNRCECIDTPPLQEYGILEDGTSDYNVIVDNICVNNVIKQIKVIGANTIYGFNYEG